MNIKKPQILGFKAYQTVKEVPGDIDLAVIATPRKPSQRWWSNAARKTF